MTDIPNCVFRWDKTPMRSYRVTVPIEEAVTDLIGYHNEERARTMPRELIQDWIDPGQESHGDNRAIKEGDVVQVRAVGALEERDYFLGCYFEFDGRNAILHMYAQNPSLALMLRGVIDRQKDLGKNRPETVGDYVLLTKGQQEHNPKRTVSLQVARFGSKKAKPAPRRTTSVRRRDGSERARFDG